MLRLVRKVARMAPMLSATMWIACWWRWGSWFDHIFEGCQLRHHGKEEHTGGWGEKGLMTAYLGLL